MLKPFLDFLQIRALYNPEHSVECYHSEDLPFALALVFCIVFTFNI